MIHRKRFTKTNSLPSRWGAGIKLYFLEGEISLDIVWNSVRKICLILTTCLIYSVTYLYYYGLMYMYFILLITDLYYVLYFVAQIVRVFTIGNSFSLAFVSFCHATIETFWAIHDFQVLEEFPDQSCTLPCSGHRINHFTKELYLCLFGFDFVCLYFENRIWKLSSVC